jgi:membrane-associated phospholipid phosphatase
MLSSCFTRGICICALAAIMAGGGAQAAAQSAPGSVPSGAGSSSASPSVASPSVSTPRVDDLTASGSFFGNLVGPTFGTFKTLPSAETAAILGFGGAAALFGHAIDHGTTRMLSTYALGRLTRRPLLAQVGGDLFRAQLVAQTMTTAIKLSVRRARPDGTQFSFPSGHTSATFASAAVLHRDLGWKVGVPAYAVATYVAASRLNEKRHFLSDVLFGAAIGIVAGRTATLGVGDARFALAPMAAPGGGGIALTWVGKH